MVVGIKVTAENVKSKVVKHTNTCYFTMVAKGDDGKPTTVPPLLLQENIDVKRFAEAMLRRELKSYHKEEVAKAKKDFTKESALNLLKGERCKIDLNH
jgi:acyl-CoA hydrolase